MLYLVRYSMTPGAAARVQEVYPRHRAYLDEFARGGEIVGIGPLVPVPGSGALSVFRTRRAAEAFPEHDPFVVEGLAVPEPVVEWDALEFP